MHAITVLSNETAAILIAIVAGNRVGASAGRVARVMPESSWLPSRILVSALFGEELRGVHRSSAFPPDPAANAITAAGAQRKGTIYDSAQLSPDDVGHYPVN